MKTKAKGFTIIELLITLAITTVILGVVYTFFFSSNKSLTDTQLKSTLQTEGQVIENELLNIGTQSKGILKIDNELASHESNKYSKLPVDSIHEENNYKREISNLEIGYENGDIAVFNCVNKKLTVEIRNSYGSVIKPLKILSENVKEFKVRPLDIRMVSDLEVARFSGAPGLEFSIVLDLKKGYSSFEYPVGLLVKFRNK